MKAKSRLYTVMCWTLPDGTEQQQRLTTAHMAAFQMVEIVKENKHLQKNMQIYLQQPDSPVFNDYMRLRCHLFKTLILFRRVTALPINKPE